MRRRYDQREMAWDSARIRRQREYGWFRGHEAEMIEKAREERRAERQRLESEETERLRALHWKKCPQCGHDMADQEIEGVHTDQCAFCQGIFFRRGELETLLLRHDEDKRGFFRNLLGFHREMPDNPAS
jgi:uncharacterized protein